MQCLYWKVNICVGINFRILRNIDIAIIIKTGVLEHKTYGYSNTGKGLE
jgi:hypothetical protein